MFRSYLIKARYALFGLVFLLAAFLLIGCGDGDDGKDGADGATGPAGPAGPAAGSAVDLENMSAEAQALLGTVSMPTDSISITIDSPPVVMFSLVDSLDRTVLGMDYVANNVYDRVIRFTLAKLVPGTNGEPDFWSNYIVSGSSGNPSYDSVRGGGTLVDNGDNTYTYTFFTDVGNDPAYDPTATHRLAGQIGGGGTGFEPSNFVFDYVPDGSSVTLRHDVAMTASCNECHDPLNIHGRRREVGYCVTCHNPAMAEGEGTLSFMAHKIHAAGKFEVLDDAIDYAEVTYPQDLRNCRKCHNANDAETPQGGNWETVQTANLCFLSCHTVPESLLDRAPFHEAITGDCAACHNNDIVPLLKIDRIHTTANATENNPGLLEGERDIDYKLNRAAINSGNLVIVFQVLSDGTPLDLTNLPADLVAGNRWPNFRFPYALPQDGIAEPADFNNLGRTAGQPGSVGIGDLEDGSDGTLVCTDGTCTATLPNPFPAGAKMRTVGIDGYFRQDLDNDGAYDVSLHTQSAMVTLPSDTPRRSIADSAGCASCHEIFEGHGGNRVFTADGGVDICTMCHNPSLSSSGRSIDPADAEARPSDAYLALGGDTLGWPEATNNFKDMIHGIHASDFRTTDYEFVRGRNDGIYYNWSEVTFPGELSNCTKCHVGDSYLPGEVPESALLTTSRTTGEYNGLDATFGDVGAARDSMPNDTDWVITPVTGACYACHDSNAMKSHMEQNGGTIDGNREFTENSESCSVCHGPGNIADVEVKHDLD